MRVGGQEWGPGREKKNFQRRNPREGGANSEKRAEYPKLTITGPGENSSTKESGTPGEKGKKSCNGKRGKGKKR